MSIVFEYLAISTKGIPCITRYLVSSQAWDEDSPIVLEDEDEDFQGYDDEDEDEDSVL